MSRIEMLAPLTGVLGIAGVIAGLAMDNTPNPTATTADIAAYVSGGVTHWFVEAMLIAVGGTLLLVFSAVLASRMEAAGASATTVRVAHSAGTAWGLLTMLGGALFAVVPVKVMFYGSAAPSAQTYHFLEATGYAVLVTVCALAASLLAVTTALASARTGLLPRWLTLVAFVAAVLILANMLLPMSAITLFYVTVSIVLTRRTTLTSALTQQVGAGAPAAS